MLYVKDSKTGKLLVTIQNIYSTYCRTFYHLNGFMLRIWTFHRLHANWLTSKQQYFKLPLEFKHAHAFIQDCTQILYCFFTRSEVWKFTNSLCTLYMETFIFRTTIPPEEIIFNREISIYLMNINRKVKFDLHRYKLS